MEGISHFSFKKHLGVYLFQVDVIQECKTSDGVIKEMNMLNCQIYNGYDKY